MQEVFEKIIEKIKEHGRTMMPVIPIDESIEIVKQAAAEYNNGWIPCNERLPEEMELVLIYAESTARGGSIRVVAQLDNGFWFAQTSSDTLGLTGIGQYNVIAWQPLPEPYQPKGVRTNCMHRHENGNCLVVGGFCTAVDDKYCKYQPKGE